MFAVRQAVVFIALIAGTVGAHPMGNFSVSHYARLSPGERNLSIQYALDFAEIPTFELMREWGIDQGAASAIVERHAREKMVQWMRGLHVLVNGKPLQMTLGRTQVVIAEGAASMPVIRVAAHVSAPIDGELLRLEYSDKNYEGRAGWKEIVVAPSEGVRIAISTHTDRDVSKALTAYPADPAYVPPQDISATVEWRRTAVASRSTSISSTPSESAVPARPPTLAPVAGGPPQSASGSVQRGDFLSTLLSRREIPFSLLLAGLGVAFALGAAHALSPGHGKTLVAAYLIGSRGTLRHAMLLGATVTFTHTASVFVLGLATLFLSQYIVPEKVVPWLGAISGLSIVMIGAALFRKRAARLLGRLEAEQHEHSHGGAHQHPGGDGLHHHVDGKYHHHHVPQGEVTLASLIALGVSGGLVPCPSALVLLLSAISIGRTTLGLLLLMAFSLGLSLVLMAIGAAVIYAKNLLPQSAKLTESRLFRLVPVLSAAVIVAVGIVMTGASLGIFRPIG